MPSCNLLKQLDPAYPAQIPPYYPSQVAFAQRQVAQGLPTYAQFLQGQNCRMGSPSAAIPRDTQPPRVDNYPMARSSHALYPTRTIRYATPSLTATANLCGRRCAINLRQSAYASYCA